MGSFNVSCGLSNVTIHEGDPVAFLLLSKREQRGGFSRRGGDYFRTMLTDETSFFKPASPLIFGEYADYGRIANVQENITTEILNEATGVSAEELVNMFEHEDPYSEYASETFKSLWTPELRSLTQEVSSLESLARVGFTVKGNKATFGGHTLLDDWGVWNLTHDEDSENIKETCSEYESTKALSLLNWFSKKTGRYPGFGYNEKAVIFSKNTYGMWFHAGVLEQALQIPDIFPFWLSTDNLDWDKYVKMLKKKRPGPISNVLLEDFKRIYGDWVYDLSQMNKIIPLLLADAEKEVTQILFLGQVMSKMNRFFAPSFSGEQFGDDEFQLSFNGIVQTLLAQRVNDLAEFDS